MPEEIKNNIEKFMNTKEETPKYPVITKITTQRRKGRYNIFLDDEYAFSVDESILVDHYLRKGMEISPTMRKTLEKEDEKRKAYQRALTYLSYALRSEKEVRDDLIKNEFEASIHFVIEKLKDQRMINDKEYAKSYVRTAANLNRKGPRVIERELKLKGIKELDIMDAMEEYPFELKIENALKLGEKTVGKSGRRSTKQTVQKVREYLMTKGYSSDVINEVLDRIEFEKDDEEEMDALRLQGDKAWRRYGKFQLREQIQKTKSNLYGKGFPMELINQYTEEKANEGQD